MRIFNKRKQQRPRGFSYTPWFYDAKKEEFENRVKDAESRYHGKKDEEYKVSKSFDFRPERHSSSQSKQSRFKTDNYGKVSPLRILILLGIIGGLIYYILF